MSPSVSSRSVRRQLYKNYLQKADELYESMLSCHENKLWNATVVNAIHCAVCSADALTVFYLGFRHAGEKHNEVLLLLGQLGIDKNELGTKIKQLSSLLAIKNSAEYEERLMAEKDAVTAMKAAQRFHFWVKSKLG